MYTKIATLLSSAVLFAGLAFADDKPRPVEGMQVYSQEVLIGRVAYFDNKNAPEFGVITKKGYLVGIDANRGNFTGNYVGNVYFSGTGCTGTAYLTALPDTWKYTQGYVFGAKNAVAGIPNNVFYVPRGSAVSAITVASYEQLVDGLCFSSPGSQTGAVAYPNDPKITGVPTEGYTLPIVFGLPLP